MFICIHNSRKHHLSFNYIIASDLLEFNFSQTVEFLWRNVIEVGGDRGGTLVKVLCYKSEDRWFDPSWCHWIFH